MSELIHHPIVVALETDASRFHGPSADRPALLDKTAAEQLAAHLSADLGELIPDIHQAALSVCGALYDQTQILSFGWPVFEALHALTVASYQGKAFQPRLVSFGAHDGRLPHTGLQPDSSLPVSIMQLIAITISGPASVVQPISHQSEHCFLEKGQLSAHSAQWISRIFDLDIRHGRFMTTADLAAMLRMQLDSVGFLPLWELLECALYRPQEALSVETALGNTFSYRSGEVHSAFQTFDYWAGTGAGRKLPYESLADAYADWTRMQRQFQITLAAHGLDMHYCLPERPQSSLTGTYYCETADRPLSTKTEGITEHSVADIGTIAVTVAHRGRQRHFYPLTPEGLNDIHRDIRAEFSTALALAYPGTLLFDRNGRFLIPERLPDQAPHS